MAESMLLGKPVIATGYSGNLDFMSDANSRLVNYRLVPVGQDLPPYKREYLWADPSLPEAAHWMRWMYEHRDEAQALGTSAQQDVRQRLSLENAGLRMLERLRALDLPRSISEAGKHKLARVA